MKKQTDSSCLPGNGSQSDGMSEKEVKPGDVAGYDEGEQYLSIWVHSIEDT